MSSRSPQNVLPPASASFAAISDMTAANFAKAKMAASADNENGKLISAHIGTLGGQMRGIDARQRVNAATMDALTNAMSNIEEVDIAEESANYNQQEILAQLGSAIIGKQNASMGYLLNLFA